MKQTVRSLSFKLTVAFLVVGILGSVLVAVLVNLQTQQQFDNFVNELYQEDLAAVHEQLTAYYQESGSWQGIENVFFADESSSDFEPGEASPDFEPGELSPDFVPYQQPPPDRLPITLVDGERQVVFGGHHYEQNEVLSANLVEQGMPIEVDGKTVGWVFLDSFERDDRNIPDAPDSPEANFLADLNRITVWSALGAGGLALLLGVWLARTISHPVRELTTATKQVAQGKLGAQVSVTSGDEIGQLAASFNQMSADLARSNELRRQMTADIAHDLRTPLSVVQGYTEALDDGKLRGNSEIYGAMHKQVKHLNRLVEDLRTLSLADAGQLSLHPMDVAPRDLLEHTVLVYAPQAEQQQVALQLDIPDELPTITVDLDRMVQVLGNLISNALRHTPSGGHIRLMAEKREKHLVFQVQDTGVGITPEDLPHVFDRFYRGNKARPESGESGLGLAIARSIVVAHNGRITVTSPPNEGATFTISLPTN
jgi:signal transduction histidine kinase